MLAVMPALASAVPAWVPLLPAAVIAEFTAATKADVLPRFAVFTLMDTPLPAKPGPLRLKVVYPGVASVLVLAVLARISDRLVAVAPGPMLVPATPDACTPESPRLAGRVHGWIGSDPD